MKELLYIPNGSFMRFALYKNNELNRVSIEEYLNHCINEKHLWETSYEAIIKAMCDNPFQYESSRVNSGIARNTKILLCELELVEV